MSIEQASSGAILQPQEGDSPSLKAFKVALFNLLAFAKKKNPENVLQWRELIQRVDNMDQTILAAAFLIYFQIIKIAKKEGVELPEDMLDMSRRKYKKIYNKASKSIVDELVKIMSGKKSTKEIDPINLQAEVLFRYIDQVARTLKENDIKI